MDFQEGGGARGEPGLKLGRGEDVLGAVHFGGRQTGEAGEVGVDVDGGGGVEGTDGG